MPLPLLFTAYHGIVLSSGLHAWARCRSVPIFAGVVLHTALAMRNMMWATQLIVVIYVSVCCGINKVDVIPLMVATIRCDASYDDLFHSWSESVWLCAPCNG